MAGVGDDMVDGRKRQSESRSATPRRAEGSALAVGRVPSRGGKEAAPRCAVGQRGSGILPRVHAGQAAGSRFHFHLAFMEGGSGILPLDVIQPKPRRLCHVSAG
jgi:hypothetical protein